MADASHYQGRVNAVQKVTETLRGDTPGTAWSFTVLRFAGSSRTAPTAYLQAALHGDELPGVAALHYLIPILAQAERAGRLLGDVTVVPYANPIALAQHLFAEHLGRFNFGSRTNYNRSFPLLATPDSCDLPSDAAPLPAEVRLKARLLKLSVGHDIVLDLHCDDEALPYLYVARELWPQAADLAACLEVAAVLLWDGASDAAFEEASLAPYAGEGATGRHVAATVEFRGRADVSPALAQADAGRLHRFLAGRGVISADNMAPPPPFAGLAAPLDQVEMLRATASGAVLYHVVPGDRVQAGDPLVTILTAPGEDGGATVLTAPQDGLILTRRARRLIRLGDDLLKLVGSRPSASARPGTLES